MTEELTAAEAAARVGVSRQQIQDKLQRGLLAGRRPTPRLWLVDAADLPATPAAWRLRFPTGRPRKQAQR